VKRLVFILAAALSAGLLGYGLVLLRAPQPPASGSDITWIRDEFRLDEAQFAAIRGLHESYSAICARHCADIAAALDELSRLREEQAPADAVAAAEKRIRFLESVCNEATRAHLRQVAALMPEAEGRRFLALIDPFLAEAPHDGARFPAP